MRYTKEWKVKKGVWVQPHIDSYGNKIYKVHYIDNDTEYSIGKFWSQKEAREFYRCYKKDQEVEG